MSSILPALCILSPHRDDAIFSLGLALQTWCARGLRLSVVTVYTRSIYAPRAVPSHHPASISPDREGSALLGHVSALRAQEDRQAFRIIDPGIHHHDLRRLDAPVRLSCRTETVFGPREHVGDESEVCQLAPEFRKSLRGSLMLAPLALGNHIDHASVRNAALHAAAQTATGPACLGFYEDLPYADWTPPASLQQNVIACEAVLRTRLSPTMIRHRRALPSKCKLVRRYSSQIDEKEVQHIARFSLRYGGGERIWIPARNCQWQMVR